MHWINFHIKHTTASQCSSYNTSCCLDHEKGLSRNFFPIHCYHRNGEKVGVVEE